MSDSLKYIKDPYRREYIALTLKNVKNVFGDSLVSFVIYGSVARGDDNEQSDVDILIVLDTSMSYSERCNVFGRILADLYRSEVAWRLMELGYNVFIEFYPLSVEEALVFRPIYLDMVYDSVILYDRNDFFRGILTRTSKILFKLGSQRIWINDREWIWILKPNLSFGEEVLYEFK